MSFLHNKALDFKAGILILDLTDILHRPWKLSFKMRHQYNFLF